jgi:hypothetical protein
MIKKVIVKQKIAGDRIMRSVKYGILDIGKYLMYYKVIRCDLPSPD